MPVIPARRAVAFPLKAGQDLKVINTFGKQVLDFWAFKSDEPNNFLSMVHTRTVLRKVAISRGDKLYSTRRKPMLTLTDDTSPGVHDLVWAACDAERYRMQGFDGYHDNCSDNLHQVHLIRILLFVQFSMETAAAVYPHWLTLCIDTTGPKGELPRVPHGC